MDAPASPFETADLDLAEDGPADRRLTLRFFATWEELADGRPMPGLKDFTPALLAPFRDRAVVIDLQEGPDAAVIRYVGSAIAAHLPDDATGMPLDTAPARSLLSRLTVHAYEVLAHRAPIGFEAEFTDGRNRELPYRAILTPLSRDGVRIDFLIGVLSWCEPAAEPAAEDDVPVPRMPAPAPDPALDPTPGPMPDPGLDPGLDMIDQLADQLAALRDAAETTGRARAALYDLLARIHGFAQLARAAPAALDTLLAEAGIRAQRRTPETAILKLVFGAGYDKTRLTEYAAALALAAREDLDVKSFRARLADRSGGLKAMVRAERRARRPDQQPDQSSGQPPEQRAVHAVIADWRRPLPAAGEVVRLLAETTGDGRLAIIAVAAPARRRQDQTRFTKPAPDSIVGP